MGQQQTFQWKKLELGTCYYPEHWDKSLWEQDLERMLEHGIATITDQATGEELFKMEQ